MSIRRALAIWILGLIAGIQVALFLFDLYDDGVADWKSCVIGLVFIAAGLLFVTATFRRGTPSPAHPAGSVRR
jgi:hypothetical protein